VALHAGLGKVAPSISVIVRSIGRASLAQALASVDAQARDDVEIVLIDAGGKLAGAPATRCPLRVVGNGQPLLRTAAARLGLASVATRYALFLDDDDLLLPGHLDKLMAALQSQPDAVLAHTGVELVRSLGDMLTSNVIDEPFEPWELLLGNRMPIHAVLFDAARVRESGVSFDESFALYEDWDFWLQLSQLGRFVHVPGVSARYFIGETSSDVHRIAHGDEAYFKLWRKWWPRAPQAWWAKALHAGESLPAARRELQGARAQAAELLAHLDGARAALTRQQQQLEQQAAEVAKLHALLGEQVQHATQPAPRVSRTWQRWSRARSVVGPQCRC
jgi:Glycosyl transferase family 2